MRKVDKELGIIIKQKRLFFGYTQTEIAKTLGYSSPQFVHLIEQGKSKVPLKTWKKLCRKLYIPKEQVFRFLLKDYAYGVAKELGLDKELKQ